MTRTIQVSTDVFSAIWAARHPGEETEDDILRRILTPREPATTKKEPKAGSSSQVGVADDRNGVIFPPGFEIFRHYKRKEYRAVAGDGVWTRLDTNQKFSSLNQLNASIAAGAENVWNGNWKFRAPDDTIHSIGELRNS